MKQMHIFTLSGAIAIVISMAAPWSVQAQSATDAAAADDPSKGPSRKAPTRHRWQVGVIIHAGAGNCQNIVATIPVPVEWPEQEVKKAKEELSSNIRSIRIRKIDGGVQQMVITLRRLAAGGVVKALVTYDIVRYSLNPPQAGRDIYVLPKKRSRELLRHLSESPMIEARNGKIRAKAEELVMGKTTAWEKAEALYDWVRENIELREGKLKGAARALKDGGGNTEDKSSLFVALCRAARIPARTVWVQGHNYAEFYLEDDEGRGHWFPCQVVGNRDFGGIGDHRPILQKGDNIKPPEQPAAMRFVPEHVRIKCRGGRPRVQFVRKLLPLEE